MNFDSKIDEIASEKSQEVAPEVLNETETLNPNEGLNEAVAEFEKNREAIHAYIYKDGEGRNVSTFCGCNYACTHSAI